MVLLKTVPPALLAEAGAARDGLTPRILGVMLGTAPLFDPANEPSTDGYPRTG